MDIDISIETADSITALLNVMEGIIKWSHRSDDYISSEARDRIIDLFIEVVAGCVKDITNDSLHNVPEPYNSIGEV